MCVLEIKKLHKRIKHWLRSIFDFPSTYSPLAPYPSVVSFPMCWYVEGTFKCTVCGKEKKGRLSYYKSCTYSEIHDLRPGKCQMGLINENKVVEGVCPSCEKAAEEAAKEDQKKKTEEGSWLHEKVPVSTGSNCPPFVPPKVRNDGIGARYMYPR